MKTLFLHIGQGKTGTSYVQASFALSAETLRDYGIVYPDDYPAYERAREGGTSSGNGRMLIEWFSGRANAASSLATLGDHHLLLSREKFYWELMRDRYGPALLRFAEERGFERIACLLFVRDPVEHSVSLYRHSIKTGATSESIDTHVGRFEEPGAALAFIESYRDEPRVTITVRNYSRVRNQLLDCAAEWLGLPLGTLKAPPVANVNRSLTIAEMRLKRALNAAGGKAVAEVGWALARRLPDMVVEPVWPSLAAQRAMLARLAPAMEQVDALLPPGERYLADLHEEPAAEPETYMFTGEQLDVIGEVVGNVISRHMQQKERLQHLTAKVALLEGRLHLNEGRTAEAIAAFERVLDRDPASLAARRMLVRARKACPEN